MKKVLLILTLILAFSGCSNHPSSTNESISEKPSSQVLLEESTSLIEKTGVAISGDDDSFIFTDEYLKRLRRVEPEYYSDVSVELPLQENVKKESWTPLRK